MSTWIIGKRFDETSLPDKESFYSSLNMENIDDIDYRQGNNVFKKFKLKKYRRIPRFIHAKRHTTTCRCI